MNVPEGKTILLLLLTFKLMAKQRFIKSKEPVPLNPVRYLYQDTLASDTSLLQRGRECSLMLHTGQHLCLLSIQTEAIWMCNTQHKMPFHSMDASSSHTKHQKICRSDQHNIHPSEVFCFPDGYKNSYHM